jgi:Spy/CpxP family protein refolding chaperone
MDRRKWFKRIGIALLGLGGVSVLAAAGFGRGACGGHGDPARMERMLGARLDGILDDLEATPEQRTKITAVKERLLEKGKALHASRGGAMQDLLAQWESPSPDRAKVHALVDARAAEMQGFAHEVADAMAEVHAILTPEQRAEVAERWRERAERHGRHGPHGRGRGEPPAQ